MSDSLEEIAKQLKSENQEKKKLKYRKSRLDIYRKQLISLSKDHAVNATELQLWLRKKRIKVAISTITRWLKKNENI